MNKARWESDGRCRERKPPIIGCHKEVVERRVGVRGCGRSQSQRLALSSWFCSSFLNLFFDHLPRGLILTHIIGASFFFTPISFPHSPFHHHFGLFFISPPCLFAISFSSLLLYSLLGPRWLIVYATNFSFFSLATNSQGLCHLSLLR
jgi:hypothetical protein